MRIVFFGTSAFAAEILKYLFPRYSIVAVVTRPDRPQGRSLRLMPPPVKVAAQSLDPNLPIYQPEKASTDEFASVLKALQPDLIVVVAFGEIIKMNLLSIPPKGCINIHASLLPKYRGAAPMQRCVMDGAKETGVTIIEMVLKMDAGDMITAAKMPVPQEMTFGELEKKLCTLACSTVDRAVQSIAQGTVVKVPQNEAEATYAPKITPEEQQIHWDRPAESIHNLIRALSPYPGAWCQIKIGDEVKRLKIKRSSIIPGLFGSPGTVADSKPNSLIVFCGKDALEIQEVQLEGKKAMSITEFLNGLKAKSSLKFVQ